MLRKNWIKSFGDDKVIELIKSDGDKHLYATHSKDYDGRASMYHVWEGDNWLYCGASYTNAWKYFDDIG